MLDGIVDDSCGGKDMFGGSVDTGPFWRLGLSMPFESRKASRRFVSILWSSLGIADDIAIG